MKSKLDNDYINLFILLQSFETLLAYVQISEGELFLKTCKEEANKFLKLFKIVSKSDNQLLYPKSLNHPFGDANEAVEEITKQLNKWIESDLIYPKFYSFEHLEIPKNRTDVITSLTTKFMLDIFIFDTKHYLLSKINLEITPALFYDPSKVRFNRNSVRWKSHLPIGAFKIADKSFMEKLSNSDTIAIVADIRKSQDLMTYGPNEDYFRDKILEFTSKMREIIIDNNGLFDKFTGDGFLCYFNSHLCEYFDQDYYIQMIKACEQIMTFSDAFFEEWIKQIRKLPPNSSGLTIGIDSGIVKFRDLDNHLFAIGDCIVWANRMCSAGKKGEIIFNNIPYHKMRGSNEKIEFEVIESSTKGGELFTAYKAILK